MNNLETAILIATRAHQGQTDKAGLPYILHPLRLMLKQDNLEAMITAVLHDVVEDTDLSLEHIAEYGFSSSVLDALRLLTHDKSTPYQEYIEAIAGNSLARQVKQADLLDNMDLSRLPSPQEKDFLRIEKYKSAYQYLTSRS